MADGDALKKLAALRAKRNRRMTVRETRRASQQGVPNLAKLQPLTEKKLAEETPPPPPPPPPPPALTKGTPAKSMRAHRRISFDGPPKPPPVSVAKAPAGGGGGEDAVGARVAYLLRVSLGPNQHPLAMRTAWRCDNPTLAVAFDRQARGRLVLDCWVDVGALGPENALARLAERGFTLPKEGMRFSAGRIMPAERWRDRELGAFRFNTRTHADRTHTYLLCHVAVGRSYVTKEGDAPTGIPPGFDSLLLEDLRAMAGVGQEPDTVEARGGEHGGGGDAGSGWFFGALQGLPAQFYHRVYVVAGHAQVLPVCAVSFAVTESAHASYAEGGGGGEPGDGAAGEADRVARAPMSPELRKKAGGASPHPQLEEGGGGGGGGGRAADLAVPKDLARLYDRCDFYDPILRTPVSVHDKLSGSHSHGPAAGHRLIPIGDAYKGVVGEIERETRDAGGGGGGGGGGRGQQDLGMEGTPRHRRGGSFDGVAQQSAGSSPPAELGAGLRAGEVVRCWQRDLDLQLARVRERREAVEGNRRDVEEALYAKLRAALFRLQDEVQEQEAVLAGEEAELTRQRAQLAWMHDYIARQRPQLAPAQFLKAHHGHLTLRDEAYRRARAHRHGTGAAVAADLMPVGDVGVVRRRDLERHKRWMDGRGGRGPAAGGPAGVDVGTAESGGPRAPPVPTFATATARVQQARLEWEEDADELAEEDEEAEEEGEEDGYAPGAFMQAAQRKKLMAAATSGNSAALRNIFFEEGKAFSSSSPQ